MLCLNSSETECGCFFLAPVCSTMKAGTPFSGFGAGPLQGSHMVTEVRLHLKMCTAANTVKLHFQSDLCLAQRGCESSTGKGSGQGD